MHCFQDLKFMNPAYFDTVFLVDPAFSDPPDRFAVITAHNPKDHLLEENENRRLLEKLKESLLDSDKSFFPVTGSSPDGRHQEAGFGISCTLQEALCIGMGFNQNAIYWVERENLQVIECSSGKAQDLGSWKERLRT
ncbi:MAG TPA: hypothetical protein DCX67_10085 [Opitutae bacterium]|nr:hypothetical protein [Opitutae bacterium]|tara:strand:- start:958 stop:1368 length:411 start_codon:yes stop_codon:yes gene_type:complete